MSWFRKHPAFATVLAVVSLVVIAEAGGIATNWAGARAAQRQVDKGNRELRALAALQPEPTAENAARLAAELARANSALAALRAELGPTGPVGGLPGKAAAPEHRPDAFFDIAVFVEAMRARARQAGVILRPDERFGFASYANEAPEAARLAAVFRERLIVQFLVESLLAARPRELLSVQRERPLEQGGRSPGGPAGVGAADYFDLDPRVSVRVPGVVETTAFRLAFTGYTTVLRSLLNKLAAFEQPVIVRMVEVAPAADPSEALTPAHPGTTSLITRPWSRFTVTVEFIELARRTVPTF